MSIFNCSRHICIPTHFRFFLFQSWKRRNFVIMLCMSHNIYAIDRCWSLLSLFSNYPNVLLLIDKLWKKNTYQLGSIFFLPFFYCCFYLLFPLGSSDGRSRLLNFWIVFHVEKEIQFTPSGLSVGDPLFTLFSAPDFLFMERRTFYYVLFSAQTIKWIPKIRH